MSTDRRFKVLQRTLKLPSITDSRLLFISLSYMMKLPDDATRLLKGPLCDHSCLIFELDVTRYFISRRRS
jgi:hypothetical protein